MIRNNKGVALLWTLLLSGVILIVGSTMAEIVIKENRLIINGQDSVRAYAAARSGIDWAIDQVEESEKTGTNPDTTNTLTIDDDSGSTASVIIATDPVDSSNKIISSVGVSNGVNRKLEYTRKRVAPASTSLAGFDSGTHTVNIGNNMGSFDLVFYFWPNKSSSKESISIQDTNTSTPLNQVRIDLNSPGLGVTLKSNNEEIFNNTGTPLAVNLTDTRPFAYKVEVKYLSDTGFSFIISRNYFHDNHKDGINDADFPDPEDPQDFGTFQIVNYLEQSTIENNFGNLSYLKFNDQSVYYSAAADPSLRGVDEIVTATPNYPLNDINYLIFSGFSLIK